MTAKKRENSNFEQAGSLSELTEDAPDMEGQTIRHWSEDTGSTRWALVEPDFAALKKELEAAEASCERLRQTLQHARAHTQKIASRAQTNEIIAELEEVRRRIKTTSLEELGGVGGSGLGYDEWHEAVGLSRTLFDYMDTDANGQVSWREFANADRLRKQFVAFKMKVEVRVIHVYVCVFI